jgi:hypothetical protein
MAAFMPGASPPLVKTAILFILPFPLMLFLSRRDKNCPTRTKIETAKNTVSTW